MPSNETPSSPKPPQIFSDYPKVSNHLTTQQMKDSRKKQ